MGGDWATCPKCKGNGVEVVWNGEAVATCRVCDGEGIAPARLADDLASYWQRCADGDFDQDRQASRHHGLDPKPCPVEVITEAMASAPKAVRDSLKEK